MVCSATASMSSSSGIGLTCLRSRPYLRRRADDEAGDPKCGASGIGLAGTAYRLWRRSNQRDINCDKLTSPSPLRPNDVRPGRNR
jgi:hypothetical protein